MSICLKGKYAKKQHTSCSKQLSHLDIRQVFRSTSNWDYSAAKIRQKTEDDTTDCAKVFPSERVYHARKPKHINFWHDDTVNMVRANYNTDKSKLSTNYKFRWKAVRLEWSGRPTKVIWKMGANISGKDEKTFKPSGEHLDRIKRGIKPS